MTILDEIIEMSDHLERLAKRRENERRAKRSRQLDKKMTDAIDFAIKAQLGEDWDK